MRSMLALLLAATAVGVSAQQRQPSTIPDLTDGWVRIDTEGSGNFGGLTSTFTPASLTPAAAAQLKATPPPAAGFDYARDPSAKPKGEGEAYVVTEGRCCGGGVPLEPNQRLPANYEPRGALACDAFDAERIAFLEKP
jgi:hypothetical protein